MKSIKRSVLAREHDLSLLAMAGLHEERLSRSILQYTRDPHSRRKPAPSMTGHAGLHWVEAKSLENSAVDFHIARYLFRVRGGNEEV